MSLTTRLGLLTVLAATFMACAPVDSTPDNDDADITEDELRVCAGGAVTQGIDVSEHNSTIDWAKVKASGRAFAFVRVSDGAQHPDTQFAKNWKGAKDAGLIRGVYQYFRPGQDPVAQADLLVAHIGTLEPDDLSPVIDVETANGQTTSKVVKDVASWVARIKAKTGRDPIIYAASGFWNTLPNTAQFKPENLWVANYGATCPSMPSTWSKWSFWQYSETGKVSGVSGGIDLDVFNGSLADLQLYAHASAGECAEDADCPTGDTCDTSVTPPVCKTSGQQPPPPDPNACPVLTFPSGIKIQTVASATTTASYAKHLNAGEEAPKCFIDVNNMVNPDTKEKYDLTVHVATNFQLSELVGTEVDQGYGTFVLVNPNAVAALQKFRTSVGKAVTINSGFRSPKHQEDVCESLCGDPLGCAGTCANNSRHMWGDAFDLPMAFYSATYTNIACNSGFKFTYLESGTHLHVDQNPKYAQCVQQ